MEAERYCEHTGLETVSVTDGVSYITSAQNSDWLSYQDVVFSQDALSVNLTIASDYTDESASISIHRDSSTGDLLGEIPIPNTGGSLVWETVSANIAIPTGTYDLYFVINAPNDTDEVVNIDVIQFSNTEIEEEEITYCSYYDGFTTLEAEEYCENSGVEILKPDGQSTTYIGAIHDGDWVKYSRLFLNQKALSFQVKVSSTTTGGQIILRKDAVDGEIIGMMDIPKTGDQTTWVDIYTSIDLDPSLFELYMVFEGDSEEDLFTINWLKFSTDPYFDQDQCLDFNAFVQIESENHCDSFGAEIGLEESTEELYMKATFDDNWIKYEAVNFDYIPKSIEINANGGFNGGVIELRGDSPTGALIGIINIPPDDGGEEVWNTYYTNQVTPFIGEYDIYLIFRNSFENDINLNWMRFRTQPITDGVNGEVEDDTSESGEEDDLESVISDREIDNITIYPSYVNDYLYIDNVEVGSRIEVYSLEGKQMLLVNVVQNELQLLIHKFSEGIYYVKFMYEDGTYRTEKIVKE